MRFFELNSGQQVSFWYDGNMCFVTCSLAGVKKFFEFDESIEACSYYYDDHYVGRIVCQGYRIYDEYNNIILEEGKCKK